MIKLKIEEKCHNCAYFEPELVEPLKVLTNRRIEIDEEVTKLIYCKNRNICNYLAEYLNKEE